VLRDGAETGGSCNDQRKSRELEFHAGHRL
jgi:hypothetical protein